MIILIREYYNSRKLVGGSNGTDGELRQQTASESRIRPQILYCQGPGAGQVYSTNFVGLSWLLLRTVETKRYRNPWPQAARKPLGFRNHIEQYR